MARQLLLLCVAVVVATIACTSSGARSAKRIDYDALEKAWEAGDARQELQSTGDEQFASLADKSDDEAKALGPQMVFVSLHASHQRESLADLAVRWKELLWNGGLDVTVYEIEAGEKVLVGLQRGVQVDDLRRFLLAQPEVREIEWNSKTFSAAATSSTKRTTNKEKATTTKKTKKKRIPRDARAKTTTAPSPTRPTASKTEL